MKHAIWVFVALYATASIVACSKSSNSNNSGGNGAVGCPAGTNFVNGICVYPDGSVYQTGAVSFSGQNFNDGYRGKTIQISNTANYKNFLADAMAICDRNGYSAGLASCDAYLNGYVRVSLQIPNPASFSESNPVPGRLTIETGPAVSYSGWYSVSMPSAGQMASCGLTFFMTGVCWTYPTVGQMQIPRNPLALDQTVYKVTNNTGFESRSLGPWGTVSQTKWVQLQAIPGQLTDSTIPFKVFYNGVTSPILRGNLLRCGDASCGLVAW